jgi:hypothetical protein
MVSFTVLRSVFPQYCWNHSHFGFHSSRVFLAIVACTSLLNIGNLVVSASYLENLADQQSRLVCTQESLIASVLPNSNYLEREAPFQNFVRASTSPANSTMVEKPILSSATSSHFRIVTEFKTDYSPSEIIKYVSERTGMTVVVVNREGPKVHGFFALATEIFDDSGAPHTLEHLVFMGSRSYPYKGILDRLATRLDTVSPF